MCLVAHPPEVLGQQGVAGVQAIGVIPSNTRPLETQPVGVVTRQKSCSENENTVSISIFLAPTGAQGVTIPALPFKHSSSFLQELLKCSTRLLNRTVRASLLFQHSPGGWTLGMEVWAVEDSARVGHPLEAGGDHVRVVPGDVIPAQVICQHHNYEQDFLLELNVNHSLISHWYSEALLHRPKPPVW